MNPFGVIATIAAYNEGEEWLSQLIDYLWQNYLYMKDFCGKYLPDFPITLLEGTYLVWMDCRKLGKSSEELEHLLIEKAKLWLNAGTMYGAEGEGFMRWNIRLSTFLADKGGGAVQGFCRLCLLKNSDDRKREKGKTSIAFPFFHISLTR